MNNCKEFLKTEFGTLYYGMVYAFYGEPVCFSAYNDRNQQFLCYSLGYDAQENLDNWLITPISAQKINDLEHKKIPLVDGILNNEVEKIKLLQIKNNGDIQEKWLSIQNIPYLIPKPDVFILEVEDITNYYQ